MSFVFALGIINEFDHIISSSFIQGQSWPPEEVNITLFPDSSKNSQAGSRVEFHCTVKGCQQVLYRWFKDGQELPGKDNSTLIFDPLEVRHFGFYYCEVRSGKSHELSSVDSKVVELDVTPAGGKSELICDFPESR